MGRASRLRPERLAGKLREVRARLDVTQTGMAELLSDDRATIVKQDISSFETGDREPSLVLLLRYSRLANVPMEAFADDDKQLPKKR